MVKMSSSNSVKRLIANEKKTQETMVIINKRVLIDSDAELTRVSLTAKISQVSTVLPEWTTTRTSATMKWESLGATPQI